MKYYIIAGEASGDLHGANLIKAIQREDKDAEFRIWGGDQMQATGAYLVSHYKEMAFMGFVGVIKNIFKIIRRISFCKKDIKQYQPDALIFIDYSGFNLRIAKWAKPFNFRKFYYISPQVWASRSGRIKLIKATIDKMFCILPFEKEFYAKHQYEVEYVGHPLVDVIAQFEPDPHFEKKHLLDNRPIIALLPGSRKQEIKSVLAIMASIIPKYQQYQFIVACAPSISDNIYKELLQDYTEVDVGLVRNKTYELLYRAFAAIVTSGTATLETALFDVPQVVVYKGSALNYAIAKKVIQVDYISLVNLISEKEVVKELIQDVFNERTLESELEKLIDGPARFTILENYKKLKTLLGEPGAASKTAKSIVQLTPSKQ
ncbi:MAG: lipid-A-disaccharide synthase [Bacteroidia bacterium]|nr:lipid-A-disaccharide synthase [Bacteroidia bacterium]